ncbi:MAG TPA: GspH/FimT family protein [Longimicrobium sp.]|nr:GspH/FimT family protein [Longimicrobium sp.]
MRRGPRRRRWRAGSRSGFTLVEIVVVLMMLAIAAAVAVPAFRPPAERSAGAAARALRELYADARNQAARRGVAVVVELTTATGEWRLAADPEDGTAPRTLAVGTLPLPAEGRLAGGREGVARAAFSPLGRARADRVTITEGEVRHEVSVDGWTGAARQGA